MQEIGQSAEYKAHNDTGKWLQWLFWSTLLAPEEAIECFYDLFMALMPTNDDRILLNDSFNESFNLTRTIM